MFQNFICISGCVWTITPLILCSMNGSLWARQYERKPSKYAVLLFECHEINVFSVYRFHKQYAHRYSTGKSNSEDQIPHACAQASRQSTDCAYIFDSFIGSCLLARHPLDHMSCFYAQIAFDSFNVPRNVIVQTILFCNKKGPNIMLIFWIYLHVFDSVFCFCF